MKTRPSFIEAGCPSPFRNSRSAQREGSPNFTINCSTRQTLVLLLVGVLLSMRLAAAAQQSGDFTYTTTGGIITITGYSGAGGAVTIPGAINGLPVAAIGGGAFARCSSLTSVTIPSGVTSIGNGDVTGLGFNDYLAVFSGCVTLEAITVDTLNPV